ncbi:hypothetical protein ACXYUI_29235, partial [Klebsiella pneumoniae]
MSLAQGELAEQRRLANEAKLASSLAWSRLRNRFPAFDERLNHFPVLPALTEDAGYLQVRIREQSDRLKAAEAAWRSADAQA